MMSTLSLGKLISFPLLLLATPMISMPPKAVEALLGQVDSASQLCSLALCVWLFVAASLRAPRAHYAHLFLIAMEALLLLSELTLGEACTRTGVCAVELAFAAPRATDMLHWMVEVALLCLMYLHVTHLQRVIHRQHEVSQGKAADKEPPRLDAEDDNSSFSSVIDDDRQLARSLVQTTLVSFAPLPPPGARRLAQRSDDDDDGPVFEPPTVAPFGLNFFGQVGEARTLLEEEHDAASDEHHPYQNVQEEEEGELEEERQEAEKETVMHDESPPPLPPTMLAPTRIKTDPSRRRQPAAMLAPTRIKSGPAPPTSAPAGWRSRPPQKLASFPPLKAELVASQRSIPHLVAIAAITLVSGATLTFLTSLLVALSANPTIQLLVNVGVYLLLAAKVGQLLRLLTAATAGHVQVLGIRTSTYKHLQVLRTLLHLPPAPQTATRRQQCPACPLVRARRLERDAARRPRRHAAAARRRRLLSRAGAAGRRLPQRPRLAALRHFWLGAHALRGDAAAPQALPAQRKVERRVQPAHRGRPRASVGGVGPWHVSE